MACRAGPVLPRCRITSYNVCYTKLLRKFLNLLQIELPPGGIASIAHRISGVLMFLSIPLLAWLFGLSLQSEQGWRAAQPGLGS